MSIGTSDFNATSKDCVLLIVKANLKAKWFLCPHFSYTPIIGSHAKVFNTVQSLHYFTFAMKWINCHNVIRPPFNEAKIEVEILMILY